MASDYRGTGDFMCTSFSVTRVGAKYCDVEQRPRHKTLYKLIYVMRSIYRELSAQVPHHTNSTLTLVKRISTRAEDLRERSTALIHEAVLVVVLKWCHLNQPTLPKSDSNAW